ncbi:MAG: hypothetical protein ACXW18_10495 [Pyrinomonadaceae bacterium]
MLAGTAEKLLAFSFTCLMVVLFANFAAAQQPNNPPFDFPAHGIEPPERNWERGTRPMREPRVVGKGPLALSDQDRTTYASFLAERNTGLIRLLPRDNPKSVFAFRGERPAIRGDGAYYSFHYGTHEYGYGSDLEFSVTQVVKGTSDRMTELPPHKNFSVGLAGADFGMLTNLGDVPLADLTLEDPRLAFMLAYETPRKESQARVEYQRFGRGIIIDGQTYKQSLPVQSNTTYLLRSINYGVSDVLVGFHVVREESDGSIIIVWKLLKPFAKPQLARNN